MASSSKITFDGNDDIESENVRPWVRDALQEDHCREKGGRANKNRPMEMSSKKPGGRFREVVQVPKRVVCDPRFVSLCGNLDVEGFKQRYNFFYENELPAEKEKLKKHMKKAKNAEVKTELKDHIAQIDKELKFVTKKHTVNEILVKHKQKERQAAQKGKQPYYLKKWIWQT